jgi:hypothetical protein
LPGIHDTLIALDGRGAHHAAAPVDCGRHILAVNGVKLTLSLDRELCHFGLEGRMTVWLRMYWPKEKDPSINNGRAARK